MSAPSTLREDSQKTFLERESSPRLSSPFRLKPPTEAGTRLESFPDGLRQVDPVNAGGGEADVWLVENEAGEQQILKLYRHEREPEQNVLEKVGQLNSSFLVRPIKTGRMENRYYELLPYYSYGSLGGLLEDTRLNPEQIREVLRQVAEGLKLLHDLDVIHRDIKPDNLLLSSVEPLQLAISDFGISRRSEMTLLLTRVAMTLYYAAPETLDEVVTKASDWWSVGSMIVELLSGSHPFKGLNDRKILFQIHSTGFPIPEDVPKGWQSLLYGLLTRDYKKRWGYPEIMEWLDGKISEEFVFEVPPTPTARHSLHPFRFARKDYTDAESLAHALAENWQEAMVLWKFENVARWLDDELNEFDRAKTLRELAADSKLDSDQKTTVALMILSDQIPLCDRNNLLSIPYFQANPAVSARFFSSSIPLWLAKIRKDKFFLELQEWRRDLSQRLLAEGVSPDTDLFEKVILMDGPQIQELCSKRFLAHERSTHPTIDALFGKTELNFFECCLLILAPQEWLKDTAACAREKLDAQIAALKKRILKFEIPVEEAFLEDRLKDPSASDLLQWPPAHRWTHPGFKRLVESDTAKDDEKIMLEAALPYFTKPRAVKAPPPPPSNRGLFGLFAGKPKVVEPTADVSVIDLPQFSALDVIAMLAPDNRTAAVVTHERKLVFWDIHELKPSPAAERLGSIPKVMAFCGDSRRLALTGDSTERSLFVVDISGRESMLRLEHPQVKEFRAVAFTNKGRCLAAAGVSPRVLEWDLQEPSRQPSGYHGNPDSLTSLDWDEDSGLMGAGARTGKVCLWQRPGSHPILEREETGSIDAIQIQPELNLTCTCSVSLDSRPGLKFSFWNMETGADQKTAFLPTTDPHFRFAISPAFHAVAVADESGLRVWTLPHPEKSILLPSDEKQWTHIAFSPYGGRLIGCSSDGFTRIWNLYELDSLAPLPNDLLK